MEIHKYKDYEEYKKIQVDCNKIKIGINRVWAREENIKIAAEELKVALDKIELGICHGTRMGNEQKWFSEFLNCEVIGTELSPTATDFPNTIQWDFHDTKAEWINNVDFIYSNSLDHSCRPKECLDTWMSCLRQGGVCILEWDESHNVLTQTDPFAASLSEYEDMVSKWPYWTIKCPDNHVLIFIHNEAKHRDFV